MPLHQKTIRGNILMLQIHLVQIKTMDTYCVSSNQNTESKNSSVKRPEQNRLMLV